MTERTRPAQPDSHRMILMPSGRQGDVPHGMTVLEGARRLGVELESICGGRQTCGKCLVSPEQGTFPRHGITSARDHLSPPEEAEQAYAAQHNINLEHYRMACAARILGDVLIHVPEESQARKQVIRKAASDIRIEVRPAVQLYYVEVPPATLGGPGDWQRLQAALADQWALQDLTIDPVILRDLPAALRTGRDRVTVTVWQGREVTRVMPGYDETLYGLAVDVGTTTVAGYLCDLRTGEVLATDAQMNPQVRYGEDLMSRVTYAMQEAQGTARMHRAIIRTINEIATRACEQAGVSPRAIMDLVLVGNTVMHHLLLGINPEALGQVPFALATHDSVDIKARDLGLNAVHTGATVHLLPCIAGHVGADNVGVLLAELPHLDDQITLIVDVGTNAEILLGNRQRLLSASSPTGPALEGAHIKHGQRAAPGAIERVRIDPDTGCVRYRVIGDDRWSDELQPGESLRPTGICGSGIIEAVAELFLHGLLEPGGRFAADASERCPAIRPDGSVAELMLAPAEETASGEPIVVTQKDIRAIQLAKGALYTGARMLMEAMGVERVDRIRLAGAFGSYIDPRHAMIIGMLPDCPLEHVQAVGNAAGDGARIALLNVDQRAQAREAARRVQYIETGGNASFQEHFVEAIPFPHARDTFPSLANLLPDRQT
ncbi:MAG: ASKHA domain-containing protein [Anaerolineae bacterium]